MNSLKKTDNKSLEFEKQKAEQLLKNKSLTDEELKKMSNEELSKLFKYS